MVVMVQKEVGETIAAAPGKMSLLSVSVQFYGKPTIIAQIPAQSFYPMPKVDSAILRIDPYSEPAVEVNDIAGFFQLVEAGFSSPRKQLHNSLAQGLSLPPSVVASLLGKIGISHQRRAETLSLEEWAEVWRLFLEYGEGQHGDFISTS
jgi:16S rRNA (adenine1518-N6/adenine1519-N6)-dimethyltransferase